MTKFNLQPCRTCLKYNADLFALERQIENCPSGKTYKDILKDITQIEFLDERESHMPQAICSLCSNQLRNTCHFIQKAKQSNDELIEIFNMAQLDCLEEQVIDVPMFESYYILPTEEGNDGFFKDATNEEIEETTLLKFELEEVTLNETTIDSDKDDEQKKNFTDHDDSLKTIEAIKSFYSDTKNYTTEDNKIQCYFCQFATARKYDLLRHMKYSHKHKIEELGRKSSAAEKGIDSDAITFDTLDEDNFVRNLLNLSQKKLRRSKLEKYKTSRPVSKSASDGKTQNKCQFCGKTCSKRHDLLRHMKSLHKKEANVLKKEMNYTKEKSNTELQTDAATDDNDDSDNDEFFYYLLKMRKTAKNPSPMQCTECDFIGNGRTSLGAHLRLRHGPNKWKESRYKCKFCDRSYTRKHDLFKHMKYTHKQLLKDIMSKGVESKNGDGGDDANRQNSFPANATKKRKGDIAQAITDNGDDYNYDDFICKMLNIRRKKHKWLGLTCDICGKVFKSKDCLRNHRLYVHIRKDKNFSCTFCKNKYKKKSHLNEHIKRKHSKTTAPPPERKFVCPLCSQSFIASNALNIHIRRHTGERPFACKLCDKTYVTQSDLKKHNYTHTGEKPYKCPFCPKNFRTSQNLTTHKRIHAKESPYECDHCSKRFNTRHNLRVHERTHTNTTNLSCKVCNKIFKTAALLNLHRIKEDLQMKLIRNEI